MLEEIRKLMAEVLKISSADVIKTREALLAEQATEDARYAASSALIHPEGSSTPIEEAYSRAQDRFATLRAQAEKDLPKVMALMMALEIAEQRRDDTQRHREQKWGSDWAKQATGLHDAARDWFPRLRRHGVHPHYLKQHSNETIAIIADLIIWKAKDPKFKKAENPWRPVLGIYARRKIDKPKKQGRSGGSVPGIPTPDTHNTGSGDYRFDEMVSAAWNVEIQEAEVVKEPPVDDGRRGIIDCSIYSEDLGAVVVENAVEMEAAEAGVTRADDREPISYSMVQDFAEFALPNHIEAEGETKLRDAATPLVDAGDIDDSLFELRWAMNDKVDALSDEEAIAIVTGKVAPSSCTAFEYFVDAARLGGKDAGLSAYREATIRRLMLMIATDLKWADVRKRLGIEERGT